MSTSTPEHFGDGHESRTAPAAHGLANGYEPVSAARVTEAFDRSEEASLEDTRPLPRYRPDRLI